MTNHAGTPGAEAELGELVEMLGGRLPDSDVLRLTGQLSALALRPRHVSMLVNHLRLHEDALTSGRSDGPACLRALIDVLAAEHRVVRRAGCAHCGSVRRLPYRVDGAGICGRCYGRAHRKECVRCGRVGPPAVREGTGVVCARCYMADPTRHEECAECGMPARVAARVDGRPLCQRCRPTKLYTCGTCGRDGQIAHAVTDDVGPICSACYHRRRVGQCQDCGRVTAALRLNSASGPVLCNRCWRAPEATCAGCGRHRPCDRDGKTGQPICTTCQRRAQAPKTCASCGRLARARARLPMGPVCGRCFTAIRRTPSPCHGCGHTRPLVGLDAAGRRICGPCTGDGAAHVCRLCGTVALLHADGRCPACVVAERLRQLLTGADGTIDPRFSGLHRMLLTEPPQRVQGWLYGTKWAQLLREVVATGEPLSHELFDAMAQRGHVRHLRQVLVHAGALPEREDPLAAVGPWLDIQLRDSPASHAALLRPYASWSVLRRARHRAQRLGATASSGRYARSRVRAALHFLTWLDERPTVLAAATQTDVERWLDAGATCRYRVRDFLRWAHARGFCAQLVVPALGRRGLAEHTLAADDRWTLLGRCLTDVELPLLVRVAGALVLLYGQTPTRIVTLTRDDITTADGVTYLALHRQPVLLPPRLAGLVDQLANDSSEPRPLLGRVPPSATWLFPGARPGTHRRPGHLGTLLNERLNLQVRPGRGGALCELAAELPSPVLAELLGISLSTAGRWVALVKRDWTSYIAERERLPVTPQTS